MQMNKKRLRRYIAFALGAALAVNGMGVSGVYTAPETVQAAGGEVFELPTGRLEKIEVYQVTDETAVADVPSYDGISLYSSTENVFEAGTGNYGYQGLNDDQKKLYSDIETALKNFNNDESAAFMNVSTTGGTVTTPFQVEIGDDMFSTGDFGEQLFQTWLAFLADHPWLFWLKNIAYQSAGNYSSTMVFMPVVADGYTVQQIRADEAVIQTAVQEYINAVSGVDDIYEKVRIVYDKIICSIDYAYQADGVTPEDAGWAHDIVGVFDSTHHKAVCEGYAKAFSFIMNILDIPNVFVTGTASGGAHAWNTVSFDGGETYHYVDATWDDTNGKKPELGIQNKYIYFAMPKDAFEKDHTANMPSGTGNDWLYALPASLGNDMDYTYYVRYAAYATKETITDKESAKEFLKGARVLAPEEDKPCQILVPSYTEVDYITSVLDIQGGYSWFVIDAYDNMALYAHEAADFQASVPAANFTLSDTELAIGTSDTEGAALTIASVTAGSDDYITFCSDNEKAAVVKPRYVKAKEGESIRVVAKGTGTANITAKSKKGGVTVSCKVTVAEGAVKPSAKPSASPIVMPSASPSAEPSGSPSAEPLESPSAEPSDSPSAKPSESPSGSPSEKPSESPSAEPSGGPSEKPSGSPSAKPSGSPSANPGTSPSGNPGSSGSTVIVPTSKPIVTPSASPSGTPSASPAATPTADPEKTPEPSPTVVPTKNPSETQPPENTPEPTVKPEQTDTPKPSVKKGTIITDKKTKAVYKVTGTGKNKTVEYKRSTKTNAKTVVIPTSVKIGGVSYKVTAISPKAFVKNISLKKVTIGKNIKKIGRKAFYQCKKLQYIIVKTDTLTLANVGADTFGNGNKRPKVSVSKKMKKKYTNIFTKRGMSKKALFVS